MRPSLNAKVSCRQISNFIIVERFKEKSYGSYYCIAKRLEAAILTTHKTLSCLATSSFPIGGHLSATSFPGFSPTRPTKRERERDPGKRWSRGFRTKLFLKEESFVSHFLSGLFATFKQLSQQQDRFAKPTTTKEISA